MNHSLITILLFIFIYTSCNNDNDEISKLSLNGNWDSVRIDTLTNSGNANILNISITKYELEVLENISYRTYYRDINGVREYYKIDTITVLFTPDEDSIVFKQKLGFEPNLNRYLYNTEQFKIITNSDSLIELYTAGNINSNVFDFRKTAISLRK